LHSIDLAAKKPVPEIATNAASRPALPDDYLATVRPLTSAPASGDMRRKNGTESSVPGVFVAGDVHDFRYRQAVTAAADGCRALLDAEKFVKQKMELKTVS